MFRVHYRADAALLLLDEGRSAEIFEIVDRDRRYLSEFLPWVDMTHSSSDIAFFIRRSLEQYARNEGFHAGIVTEGRVCGFIGLKPIDWANRKVEIGYWLASNCQGRGLVTDGVRCVLDYLFGELQLHRAEIRVAVGNRKSAAIPARLGFVPEGVQRHAQRHREKWLDIEMFAMLAPDWMAAVDRRGQRDEQGVTP
jgi:ribosomal-protein-serine acetyltransferase